MKVELSEGEMLYMRYHFDTLSNADRARMKVPEVDAAYRAAPTTIPPKLRAACAEAVVQEQRANGKSSRIWDAVRDSARG